MNVLYFICILILTEATLFKPHTLLFKTYPKSGLKHHIFWKGNNSRIIHWKTQIGR